MARAGRAGHDLVGWLMWDPEAIARYEDLGVPNGLGHRSFRPLQHARHAPPAAVAAITYSINPDVIEMVLAAWRGVTDAESICQVRDTSVEQGLETIAPGLGSSLAPLADDLWRGVDAVHHGARPLFAANRAQARPGPDRPVLSAWLAANCLRELRGDNHWALCAAADLDDVEVGLLHSAMIDVEEYGGEEWIARSRGADDEAIARGWSRLEAKGLATDSALNDAGRQFRLDLEDRTNALTTPAWQAIGEASTVRFCDAIDAHHDAFVARIDATAGPRWMPAVRRQPA